MTVKSITYYFSQLRLSLVILTIMAIGLGLTSFQAPTTANTTQGREVRVIPTSAIVGKDVAVRVQLVAQGDENAIRFILKFENAIFSISSVTAGPDTPPDKITFTPDQESGQVEVVIGLDPGQTFNAGMREIAFVNFTVKTDAPARTSQITFGDTPRVVADVNANLLPTAFTQGNINVTNPKPKLVRLDPDTKNAGDVGFRLTVTGSDTASDEGFIAASVVQWDGIPQSTLFVDTDELRVQIPAADIAKAGIVRVTVVNPTPGGGSSSLNFTINNVVPVVTNATPTSAVTGSPDVAVSVNGTGFVSGSKIRLDSADLTTTFVSGMQLTAMIPAASLATAGAANLTVFNPAPGGGTSNAVSFAINNPAPALTTISPASMLAGSAGFTLTVNGSSFVTGSTVQWNGASRTTTFGSESQLTAAISAADVASIGTSGITVVSPAPGGGTSNAVNFQVAQPPFAPAITNLSPAFAIAGGQQFTLTVNGANFASNSVVRLNDSDRVTTFVSATRLTATIPPTDIATQGTANVRVFTPAPGGGTSNTAPFFVGSQLITSASAASYFSTELADQSIIAGFGLNLATQTQLAPLQPLPTILAGSRLTVRDSAGTERPAPLYFVSAQQVNFQAPPGTADGLATVIATSGDNKISVGGLQVTRIAPGIFTANADGRGVAAATVLRVKADNSRTFESIVRFDTAQNKFVSVPVDLGPATDQVFLVLFGTGFRNRDSLSTVSVSIGGANGQVTFAGIAPGFVGLDQANILIPRSLIGRNSELDVMMTVGGKVANTVRLAVK